MPSFQHEVLLHLFRNRPLLAPTLLRDALHQRLPEFTEARLDSAELTDIQPAEYRADLVVLLLHGRAVLGIVVEAQLTRDDAKHYAWPAYVANLRARIKAPVLLLVIAPDQHVARWAATPIEMGSGWRFIPHVLSPTAVPQVIDPLIAQQDPEIAVFSAMVHGRRADLDTAVQIALVAIDASAGLDADRSSLYVDLVLSSLTDAARRVLQAMNPANYEYQSEFARRYFSAGKAEGKVEGIVEGKVEGEIEGTLRGKAELLIRLATMKFGTVPAAAQQRVHGASAAELDRIAERLLGATTLDEMLGP
jgi:hypothetical protein